MEEPRRDSERIVFVATLMLCLISTAIYLIVFLTLFRYGMLNNEGRTFAVVALVISAIAMLLACFLALTSHSPAWATAGMSGLGWILICAGLVVGAPALGLELGTPRNSFGGVPAALFMIIAGSAILQVERNLQQSSH
jgi:hypothetical protein